MRAWCIHMFAPNLTPECTGIASWSVLPSRMHACVLCMEPWEAKRGPSCRPACTHASLVSHGSLDVPQMIHVYICTVYMPCTHVSGHLPSVSKGLSLCSEGHRMAEPSRGCTVSPWWPSPSLGK